MRLREWRKGAASLAAMPCPATVSASRWRALIADTARFVRGDWARRAAELGWDSASLFGCHPDRPEARLDCRGALWGIEGADIVAVTAAEIVIHLKTGSRLACHRPSAAPCEPIVMAWQLEKPFAEDPDERPTNVA